MQVPAADPSLMASLHVHVQELSADVIHDLVLQGFEQEQHGMAWGLASMLTNLPGAEDISTQQILEGLEAIVDVATVCATVRTVQNLVDQAAANAIAHWRPVIGAYDR
jgi:hypothetical protein